MHEYDVAMKLLLLGPAEMVLSSLNAGAVKNWLNVELPEAQTTRVDLLGETFDGRLVHIEVQSSNDPSMPLRMAEYCLRIYRKFGKFPDQIVLYVGGDRLRMKTRLRSSSLRFRYRLIDIRKIDGERLLASDRVGDNVIAILARLQDREAAVRQVLDVIVGLPEPERESVFNQLLIISGLRKLEEFVEKEARKMPILNDLMDHKVLGREFKRGHEEGLQEGLMEGLRQGEWNILRKQIEKRFGAVPPRIEEQLMSLSASELENLSVRLLDARSLAELLE